MKIKLNNTRRVMNKYLTKSNQSNIFNCHVHYPSDEETETQKDCDLLRITELEN